MLRWCRRDWPRTAFASSVGGARGRGGWALGRQRRTPSIGPVALLRNSVSSLGVVRRGARTEVEMAMGKYSEKDAAKDTKSGGKEVARAWHEARDDDNADRGMLDRAISRGDVDKVREIVGLDTDKGSSKK